MTFKYFATLAFFLIAATPVTAKESKKDASARKPASAVSGSFYCEKSQFYEGNYEASLQTILNQKCDATKSFSVMKDTAGDFRDFAFCCIAK